jgi:hypothetical protein
MSVDYDNYIVHVKRSGQKLKKFKCFCEKCGSDRGFQPKANVNRFCLSCVRYSDGYKHKHQNAIKATRSSPESRAKTVAHNAKRWERVRKEKTIKDKTAISIINSVSLTHYMYAHYRCDNNQIFYVGISSEKGPKYKRYLVSRGRSDKWNQITNQAGGWYAKIIRIFDSRQELESAEVSILTILRILRFDIANIAIGGGRGSLGLRHKPETIEKLRIASLGKKFSKEVRRLASIRSKNMWANPEHRKKHKFTAPNCKPVICLNNNMQFESIHAAARWVGIKGTLLAYYVQTGRPYKGLRFSVQ